jgi:hypothetical protein
MGPPKGQVRRTAYPASDTLRHKDRPSTALWRVGCGRTEGATPHLQASTDGVNLSGSGQSCGRMVFMRPLLFTLNEEACL